jgi:hypothetical protein
MKNNVINLFGDKNFIENNGTKYSKLLEELLVPFEDDFQDEEYLEDIFEFAITAWNFGNMKNIVPKKEFNNIVAAFETNKDIVLLIKMINYKVAKFSSYNNFIVDYELTEKNGEPTLTVVTQESEAYLQNMLDDSSFQQDDFEENYIDRSAIILKPRQPFFDWINKLYSEEEPINEVNDSNVYLVSDDIDDLEKWLIKKFDKFFMMELEDWHSNKKDWPKNRSYKMFKEWFDVSVSDFIYDLEKKPIIKEN